VVQSQRVRRTLMACMKANSLFFRDQLWRNDGSYRPPAPGEAYPPDLDDYPEPGGGWQNEQGTRIDMGHRLIPKPPLRSVLKPTNYKSQDGIIAGYLTAVPSSPTSDDEC